MRRICVRAVSPILLLFLAVTVATGQSRIPDQYQKKDKLSLNPMTISVHVGWGFFPSGPEMRPLFSGTQNSTFGGPHFALQALFPVPFLWDHLTLGADIWVHRMAKRYLEYVPGVYYTGTGERVKVDETVTGLGANGVADILLHSQLHLQLGGGLIYLDPSKLDVPQEVTGLFAAKVEPVLYGALIYSIARYEHGSVDISLRVLKETGTWNNLIVQTNLGFAFRF